MAGVAFVLCSLTVTFDSNVESDKESITKEEDEGASGEEEKDEKAATKKKLIDFCGERASCYCHNSCRMRGGVWSFCLAGSSIWLIDQACAVKMAGFEKALFCDIFQVNNHAKRKKKKRRTRPTSTHLVRTSVNNELKNFQANGKRTTF